MGNMLKNMWNMWKKSQQKNQHQNRSKARQHTGAPRLWEVDLLRGIAIILVVVFHFFYDLDWLGILQNEMYAGGWLVLQRIAASSFLGLVGVSLILAWQKYKEGFSQHCLKRGLFIFLWGMAVSLATFIAVGDWFVRFGVLHLIGLAIIIAPFLVRLHPLVHFFLGVALLLSGNAIKMMSITAPWLLWLGVRYPGFRSVDYFPVIPWLGVILLGMAGGMVLFPNGKRKIKLPKSIPDELALIAWLGQKTLVIYLIHQPIIVGLLYLFTLL